MGQPDRDDHQVALACGVLEAALFVAEEPLARARLWQLVAAHFERTGVPAEEQVFARALERLQEVSADPSRGLVLVEIDGKLRLRSDPRFGHVLADLRATRPSRLSKAAAETLAIVAYRQPVTRAEIEALRGVGSSGTLSTLVERELIRIVGKRDDIGRPILYGTTDFFLSFFGLSSLKGLPALTDLAELHDDHIPPNEAPEPEEDT
jgi:segregation and condensation protein B